MTPAPRPFGPAPAQEYATLETTQTAGDLASPPAITAQTGSAEVAPPNESLAVSGSEDAATERDIERPAGPARIFAPSPPSFAGMTDSLPDTPRRTYDFPMAAPLAHAAPLKSSIPPAELSRPDSVYVAFPNAGAVSTGSLAGKEAERMHPAEHLSDPEPDGSDWQRVDRTPQAPITDYSVFRYVRPAQKPVAPTQPGGPDNAGTLAITRPSIPERIHPESLEGRAPDPRASLELDRASPTASMGASLIAEPAHPAAPEGARHGVDAPYATGLALSEGAGDRGGLVSTGTSPDFLVLAGMLGMGLAHVDSVGAVWPLNEAGVTLLEALGGADGGPAPTAIIEALSFARAGDKPFLRDTPAPSPEARHISVAAVTSSHGGGLVALRDHTEETLLQERLLQSEKMASVGQLVSGVAHELNNPLTGVMGFAQLLLARELDLTVRGQIQTIYGEAERAAKIVQNLLSFARRRKPTKEMCDINALLQRVLELRSYDFNIRNISLDMTMDSRLPAVWADPDQIQQVFFNVIKNAEQAMIDAHRGGKLTVTTSGTAGGVRISIADSGPGIPADVQRRIFDPFFTTKEAGEGTGLGLTICYGIMEEHNGRIWTENLPAGGAGFNIELPIGKPDEPDFYDRGVDDQSLLPAPSVSSRSVLVVDDEESIRLLLHDILRLDDHAVRIARSGLEAFDLVRAEHFDVIITDMKMPGMDGATFYREVRLRDPFLARRIIFITGDTVSPDTRAFLQRVSNPVLSKPFKIGPLRDAIETVLHQQ